MHSTLSKPASAADSAGENNVGGFATAVIKHAVGICAAYVVYAISGLLLVGEIKGIEESDPGWFSDSINFVVIVLFQYVSIVALYNTVRGQKRRKILYSMTLHYVLVVFVMQLETLYFKSQLSVSIETAARLFVFGLPLSILIPLYLALFPSVTGFTQGQADSFGNSGISSLLFVATGSALYVIIYLVAGYYLAWVHDEVRLFYGYTDKLLSFPAHLIFLATQEPSLIAFQFLRGSIWSVCALIILHETRMRSLLFTIVLISFLLSMPQNVAHIGQNPIITESKVRFIHLIETVSSMALYGCLLCFIYRKTQSQQKPE